MSKEIKLDDVTSLSQEDLMYVAERGQLKPEHLAELGLTEEDLRGMLRLHSVGTVMKTPEQSSRFTPTAEEIEHLKRRRARTETPNIDPEGLSQVLQKDDDEGEEEDEGDGYDQMTNDQIRGLLVNRVDAEGNTLSVEGKKVEMIERLRQHDADNVQSE